MAADSREGTVCRVFPGLHVLAGAPWREVFTRPRVTRWTPATGKAPWTGQAPSDGSLAVVNVKLYIRPLQRRHSFGPEVFFSGRDIYFFQGVIESLNSSVLIFE